MRTMLVDLLLAAVGVVSVLPTLGGDPQLLPVVVLVVAPLVARRRWPVPVFGWVLAGSALLGLGSPYAVRGLALLIALYTVAAFRPLPVALTAAAALESGVVVAAVRQPGFWVTPAVYLTGMLVAALGLGLYVGAHRALVAGLRDRTAALERERDTAAALAAVAERARIARELHDIVAHHLTVMVALSDGAAAVASAGTEVMRAVAATGRQALAETRRAVGVSRARLDPLPGVDDLIGLVAGVEAAGLATTLEVAGPVGSLPDGVQLAAYRVVQEALTNTLKHAGPGARAAVRLSATAAEIRIDITDTGAESAAGPVPAVDGASASGWVLTVDGASASGWVLTVDGASASGSVPVVDRAFACGSVPTGDRAAAGVGGSVLRARRGSGLVGMGERVGAYGGSLRSGPRSGGGWQVAASLPVES